MADNFNALGLSERLLATSGAAGYERPSSLQAAAFPVLRRGGNVVLHASSGSGVTSAWALPLLERLLEGDAVADGPRALVLAPTMDRAEQIARTLSTLSADAVAVRPTMPGWSAGAAVVVTTPQRAMSDVQGSTLKLEALQALVITDLAEINRLRSDALDTLVGLVPRDAQRIVTTGELNADVDRFVDANVRKALSIPPRAADPAMEAPVKRESLGQIGYLTATEREKAEMVARLLEGVQETAVVYARSTSRAEELSRELARRGVTGSNIRVRTFETDAGTADRIISYDVPFDTDELRRLHATGGTVIITPSQLGHLKRMAKEAPFQLKLRRARELDTTELDEFRATVRAAFDSEDVQAQLLVLDPLFDEYSPAEVAAALSALLRRKAPASKSTAMSSPSSVAGAAPKEAQTGSGFTRLFISVGTRDNIRPGDLVGAITGEAGVKGDQVGRVDIRETFSVVEVMASVSDKVIRSLNGTTMRGRSLRVDYDRKGMGGGDAPQRSDRPRGDRPPPRGDRPMRGDGPPRGDRPPRRDGPPPRGGGGGERPPRRDGPPRPRRPEW